MGRRLGGDQGRQAGADPRAGQDELADAALADPVAQAERGLGVAGLDRVAEEQQVRRRQAADLLRRRVARNSGDGAHAIRSRPSG
jgi:hypothetical protein